MCNLKAFKMCNIFLTSSTDPYSQEDGTTPPVSDALVQTLLAQRQAKEEDEEEGY